MHKYIFAILILCIDCIFSFAEKSLSQNVPEEGLFKLKGHNFSVTIDANAGGRIVSLEYSGKEFLTSTNEDPFSYGSTLWYSPQSIWNWPPPKNLDYKPYTVVSNKDTLILQSKIDKKSGLLFRKLFFIAKDSSRLNIQYEIWNASQSGIKISAWEVTRLYKGGKVVIPEGLPLSIKHFVEKKKREWYNTPDASLFKNLIRNENYLIYDIPEKYMPVYDKIYTDGSDGWCAYLINGVVFVKKFDDVALSDIPPEHGEIEVYVNDVSNYIELQQHSAYTILEPGIKMEWNVQWLVFPFDETDPGKVGPLIKKAISKM
jgi:hypothetical protein